MKAIKRKLFLLFRLIFLLITIGCNNKRDTHFLTLPDSLFCEGDIVFRRGTGLISRMVLTTDKRGSYSHVGILVKDENQWKIVHAVPGEPNFKGDPDRVKMEDIKDFLSWEKAKAGIVMRMKDNEAGHIRAAKNAIRLFHSNILFDHDYNLQDSSKMYCTELIDYVFKQEGIDLTEGRRTQINVPGLSGAYILPNDILQNKQLSLIYYY
ncbi:hypothetical protein EZS27_002905 [termite gut metagenome]|uniref:Permuted papain-like amidase YaeF/Yiix C92 family enzyme n=1 Tax=termite gut metagenome TaxID=433724 RepID=A0A5J4SUL3_9ZZZZ